MATPDPHCGVWPAVSKTNFFKFCKKETLYELWYWRNYDLEEMIDFCEEQFKNKVYFTKFNQWYFENEEDMIAFKLRWE